MGGITYIDINYDTQWVQNSLAGVQGFSWLFEWGMYIFLLVSLAILFWIFFDSITKKKDQKALVPRILAMVGFFAIIPAFIFRFTGNADGVSTYVRLNAEQGMPYYPGPINWNVNWLVSGFGPIIAIIALFGMVLSIAAIVIYMSTVHRARPATEFVRGMNRRMDMLEDQNRMRQSVPSGGVPSGGVPSQGAMGSAPRPGVNPSMRSNTAATIIDRKPQAATVIDEPSSGASISFKNSSDIRQSQNLPMRDVTIGREATKCQVVLDDDRVSREHVRLVYRGSVWSALDLGSANGTYVNGVRINGQTDLSNGDIIKIGGTTITFHNLV